MVQDYILQKAGIKGIVSLHRDNVGKGGQTSELLTQRYLRELPPKLYAQLLKIYQVDLDMFGYEAPKFDYNSPSVLSSLMMYWFLHFIGQHLTFRKLSLPLEKATVHFEKTVLNCNFPKIFCLVRSDSRLAKAILIFSFRIFHPEFQRYVKSTQNYFLLYIPTLPSQIDTRSQCHEHFYGSIATLDWYKELWLVMVTWLRTGNNIALFQHWIASLL